MSLEKFFEKKLYHDEYAEALFKRNSNMLVPWYLMASYAYYILNKTIISDACFDKIGKQLAKNWRITEHRHKYLLGKIADSKSFNTGFDLPFNEFPEMIKGATLKLLKELDVN